MLNKLLLSGFILTSAVSVISSVNAMEDDDAQKTHANNSIHIGDVTIENDAKTSILRLNHRQIKEILGNDEVIATKQGHVTTNLGTFSLTLRANTLFDLMRDRGEEKSTLNARGEHEFLEASCGMISSTGYETPSQGIIFWFTLKPLYK